LRTVAKVDSIGFVVRKCTQCSAGKWYHLTWAKLVHIVAVDLGEGFSEIVG
jgi:hypothetical protein